MKQKIVISVSMPCEKRRSQAMVMAARAPGVSSVVLGGDSKDRLEVVGEGVDAVCLAARLRKKFRGHADILQVEEVKDKKPEEKPKEPDPPKPPVPAPCGYPPCASYYCHPFPPAMVCEESNTCSVM